MRGLTKTILIVIVGLSIGFGIGYFIFHTSETISDSEEHIERIDSLESEISILEPKNDSINTVIDTVYIRIKENNKRYEENSNIIINNSTNDNYLFFTDYINRNKLRFDSIYNF